MNTAQTAKAAVLSRQIKAEAQLLGFELVGISPAKAPPHEASFAAWLRQGFAGEMHYLERTERLRRDPLALMPWAVSVISAGMNYYTPYPRPNSPRAARGWISRYAWGDDYHDLLQSRLHALLERIVDLAGEPVQGRAFVDSGPVLERDFAGLAGIGWIGKNTHLISPRKGSWFFLGELFVSLTLAYDRPMRDRCGKCELCLRACPTQAFVGPYLLDARRCLSYLTIELKGWMPRHLRPLVGDHVFGCDICQEVCPYNVKANVSAEAAYGPRPGLHAPELIPLLAMDEATFRRRFRGSPILRAKRRGFLRNVAVALGNSRSVEAVPALSRALDDHDALVRGHAAWALGQIGSEQARAALERRLGVEQDREAKGEMAAALELWRVRAQNEGEVKERP